MATRPEACSDIDWGGHPEVPVPVDVWQEASLLTAPWLGSETPCGEATFCCIGSFPR